MGQFLPPLAWFSAFEAAARHLSFTAAAAELNLTQSAISQHVRSLERRLNCALFIRKHRRIALTDEGRRLLPSVARSIGSLREAALAFDVSDAKRILTISASISVVQTFIVPRISAFMAEHTGWGIRLTTRVWPDEFLGASADVEIRFGPLDTAANKTQMLRPDKLVVVASPNLLPSGDASLPTPEEIAVMPLVQVLGTSDNWQSWAGQVGYEGALNIVCSVESHGMAVDCAVAGIGAAYTSKLISRPSVAKRTLIHLENCDHPAGDGYLIKLGENENWDMSVAFANWLGFEIDAA